MVCKKSRGRQAGRIALGALGLAGALTAPSRAAVQYTVTDLAPTPIGMPAKATCINNANRTVGLVEFGGSSFQQVRWQGNVLFWQPTTNGGGPTFSRGIYEPLEPDFPTFPKIGRAHV